MSKQNNDNWNNNNNDNNWTKNQPAIPTDQWQTYQPINNIHNHIIENAVIQHTAIINDIYGKFN